MHDEEDLISQVAGAASALANVSFELEVDGVDARWGVRSVSIREAVSEAYRGIVEAIVDGELLDIPALLGKKFALRIERDEEQRTVRGMVRHASAANVAGDTQYTLHVVPSIDLAPRPRPRHAHVSGCDDPRTRRTRAPGEARERRRGR